MKSILFEFNPIDPNLICIFWKIFCFLSSKLVPTNKQRLDYSKIISELRNYAHKFVTYVFVRFYYVFYNWSQNTAFLMFGYWVTPRQPVFRSFDDVGHNLRCFLCGLFIFVATYMGSWLVWWHSSWLGLGVWLLNWNWILF